MSIANKFLKKIPQYTRNNRHLRAFVQHGTPKKVLNFFRAEIDRKMKRVKVKGHPYILILDPNNFCNLRCPLCPTGVGELGRKQSMMGLDKFKKYFKPFAPYIFEVYMHSWGESLLNKETYSMIKYAQSKNVGTTLSSNFNKITDKDIENILESGLEYLIISLDGTDQESYEKYRVGGNYERVTTNVKKLIDRRNELKMSTPVVEWQYIVMKHNEHQVDEAEIISKELGVDLLRFIPVGMPMDFKNRKKLAEQWFPIQAEARSEIDETTGQTFGLEAKPGPCFYLYRTMVVNPDSGVSPCCEVYKGKHDFVKLDDLDEINVMDIYNSDKYQSARSLFVNTDRIKEAPGCCAGCDRFERPEWRKGRLPQYKGAKQVSRVAKTPCGH